jgi:hypothetical protein
MMTKIAQLDGSNIGDIADCKTLYPSTSFPASGPSGEWLAQNACAEVVTFLPFDSATQRSEGVDPYLSDGKVYTRRIVDMTDEELAEADKEKKARNRQQSIASIEQEFEDTVSKITEGYTESEIQTWDQQAFEAQAFLLDNTFDTPLIDAILSGVDKTKLEFCELIVSKRDIYKPAVGSALAVKNKSLTEIGEDGLRPTDQELSAKGL